MDNKIDYDAILTKLDIVSTRRREIALARVNAELDAINKVRDAYYDGAYDAVQEIKNSVAAEEKNRNKTTANPA